MTFFVDYPSLPQDGIEAVARWAATQGIDVQIPVALAGDPINTLIKIDMDGAISISDLPPAGSNQ